MTKLVTHIMVWNYKECTKTLSDLRHHGCVYHNSQLHIQYKMLHCKDGITILISALGPVSDFLKGNVFLSWFTIVYIHITETQK